MPSAYLVLLWNHVQCFSSREIINERIVIAAVEVFNLVFWELATVDYSINLSVSSTSEQAIANQYFALVWLTAHR